MWKKVDGSQIGLQFPDELLPSSVKVYRAIQRRIAASGAQSYVLADSTYGRSVRHPGCPSVIYCSQTGLIGSQQLLS